MGIETIAIAAVAAAVVGSGVAAYGSYQSGQAQKEQASYQSQVAANNAIVAQRNSALAGVNATYTEQGGVLAEQDYIRKSRSLIGSQVAAQAANGLLVNEGSALDVRESTRQLSKAGFASIRDNTARQAAGFRIQGLNADSASADALISGDMYRSAGKNAETAGNLGAASNALSGVSKAGGMYADMSATGMPFASVKTVS